MKQVAIIPLARKKLAQRAIDEYLVIKTLNRPEQVVDGHNGRFVAQKRYRIRENDYLLRVVYEETENQVVVITGYLTTKISRYLDSKGWSNES